MVGTAIATARLDEWDLAVLGKEESAVQVQLVNLTYLGDDSFDKFGQSWVDKVGYHADRLLLTGVKCALNVTSHILL